MLLALLVAAELACFFVWTTGAGPQKKLANRVFSERVPANFNVSAQEILSLKALDDVTTEIALPISHDQKSMVSLSYYLGSTLHVLETTRSNSLSIVNFRKFRDIYSYSEKESFWSALASQSKNREIILALGGSTTAFSWGWPSYLAHFLEEEFPGRFLVFNLVQPGDKVSDYRFRYESHVRPFLKSFNRSLHSILTFDGVNDLAYPVFLHVNKLADYPVSQFCENLIVGPVEQEGVDLTIHKVLISKKSSNIVGDGTGLIVDGIAEILPAIPKWEKPYGVLDESNGLPRSFFANVRPAISTDNVLRIYRDTRRMPLATDVGSSTAQSDEVINGLMAPLLRLRKNGLSLPPKPRNQNGIVVELPKALISPENSDSSIFAAIAKPSKEKPSDRMLFVVESQSHWNTHYRYCDLEKVGWTSC